MLRSEARESFTTVTVAIFPPNPQLQNLANDLFICVNYGISENW